MTTGTGGGPRGGKHLALSYQEQDGFKLARVLPLYYFLKTKLPAIVSGRLPLPCSAQALWYVCNLQTIIVTGMHLSCSAACMGVVGTALTIADSGDSRLEDEDRYNDSLDCCDLHFVSALLTLPLALHQCLR